MIESKISTIDWAALNVDQYVQKNFNGCGEHDLSIFRRLIEFNKQFGFGRSGSFLDFGFGGNMYPIIAACPYFDMFTLYDPNPGAKQYALSELSKQPILPDYSTYKSICDLVCGGHSYLNMAGCEIRTEKPSAQFDVVNMHCVAESANESLEGFSETFSEAMGYVKPGGGLFATFMALSDNWTDGKNSFPAVPITEFHVEYELLKYADQINSKRLDPVPSRGIARAGKFGETYLFTLELIKR